MTGYADGYRQAYVDHARALSNYLHRLADKVEQQAAPNEVATIPHSTGRHTQAAARALDEVNWGIANAHLVDLMVKAVEADNAERVAKERDW